ncbi:MAG: rhodanese-like domain-containing protein [Cyanobacteriota bacterium]|nr:rhodanese-like domain-containing protein [Cyanobacteriota bacterium]
MPTPNEPPLQISVEELADRLRDRDRPVQLIDVREPQEIAIASIPGFEVLSLSQFAQWSEEIITRFDPEVETLVLCHHGVRSAQMCYWLRTQGFGCVKNIMGGIDAYAARVDRNIPQY